MILYQIISAEQGKCCDKNPFGSLHSDKDKVMPFCETREIAALIFVTTKCCPCGCNMLYHIDTPFVSSGQTNGGPPIAIRCYERKFHLTSDNYREALRKEYELELKLKNETK